jgi:hypothetical protein
LADEDKPLEDFIKFLAAEDAFAAAFVALFALLLLFDDIF